MKTAILAAALATGLSTLSPSAAAWYQWYYQHSPFASAPGFQLYQELPYGVPGANPLLVQTLPWLWFYQPNLLQWWMMPNMTSGTFVEQTQSPLGYHVLVHTPGSGPGNLQIAVEAGAIVIRSARQAMGAQPFQMQQTGWSNRWVTLPGDANLAAMRMSRAEDGVEIFVPRFR